MWSTNSTPLVSCGKRKENWKRDAMPGRAILHVFSCFGVFLQSTAVFREPSSSRLAPLIIASRPTYPFERDSRMRCFFIISFLLLGGGLAAQRNGPTCHTWALFLQEVVIFRVIEEGEKGRDLLVFGPLVRSTRCADFPFISRLHRFLTAPGRARVVEWPVAERAELLRARGMCWRYLYRDSKRR